MENGMESPKTEISVAATQFDAELSENDSEGSHGNSAEGRGSRVRRRGIKDLLEYSASKDIGELPAKKRRRARSTGQYISTGRPRGRPRKHPLQSAATAHSASMDAMLSKTDNISHYGDLHAASPGSLAGSGNAGDVDVEGEEGGEEGRGEERRGEERSGPEISIGPGRSDKTSRFRGVSWDPQKRAFKARVYYGGREECIGHFSTEDEAARARDRAAMRIQGNFAKLNFFSPDAKSSSEVRTPESRAVSTHHISKYRGVSWQPTGARSGMWRVRLFHEGHDYTIGYYRDEEEAGRAYDREALRLKGPACKLNFPLDADYTMNMPSKPARTPRARDEITSPSPATLTEGSPRYRWPTASSPGERRAAFEGPSSALVTPTTSRRRADAALKEDVIYEVPHELEAEDELDHVSGFKRPFERHEDEDGYDSSFEPDEGEVQPEEDTGAEDDVAGHTLLLLAAALS